MGYETDPRDLTETGEDISVLEKKDLIQILTNHLSGGMYRKLDGEKPFERRSDEELRALVIERAAVPYVEKSWPLSVSLFGKQAIEREMREVYPDSTMHFRSWITPRFFSVPQSSVPENAGIRTAVFGTLWMVVITILIAFPLGVGAAIYLEEYAADTRLNRFIEVNIYNLAGVPSIIYGLLGLAVFVRFLLPLTSGTAFGLGNEATASGRTILSAGFTLAVLVLPTIIIASREAIRAVPQSLRQSGFGLGATRWQTIRDLVLPAAAARIITGVILAVSRAIGETAPLVVVGASTFVVMDPTNIFAKFTTLPVQIYQWTSRPQVEFRNAAAAAIIVLLVMLLSLNAGAILLRNSYGKQRGLG